MSTVTVQIVLHGLIALVPIPIDSPTVNRMTALLLDAREAPNDMPEDYGKCFIEHKPQIEFLTDASECTSVTGCSLNNSICTCPLNRHEILIEPVREPISKVPIKKDSPPRDLPLDNLRAADFAYIANLSLVPGLSAKNNTLAPAFLSASPPAKLAARFTFSFDSLTPCDFSSRRDDRADNVHSLSFRPLKQEEKEGELSQALIQKLIATANLDDDGTGFTLRLHPLDGGQDRTFKLEQAPPPHGVIPAPPPQIEITLSNPRNHFHHPDEPCDDGIARDFALFYELAEEPPAWNLRPIPHVKYTQWKSAADIEPVKCRELQDKAPMDRPICPMASFNP